MSASPVDTGRSFRTQTRRGRSGANIGCSRKEAKRVRSGRRVGVGCAKAGPAANNPGLRAVLRRLASSALRQRTLEANRIDCGASLLPGPPRGFVRLATGDVSTAADRASRGSRNERGVHVLERFAEMSVKRRSLLVAVRDRMRHRARVLQSEADDEHARAAAARPVAKPSGVAAADHELEQLAAEARYHRDRFELYRARIISGSGAETSTARLRELERTATAAQERVRHARRVRSSSAEPGA
jgi:hypothetical protein